MSEATAEAFIEWTRKDWAANAPPSAFATIPNRAAFAHILDKFTDADFPQPTGYNVMVLQYITPEKTKGGIYTAPKTQAEDEYQGYVGLVLATGPDAYKDGKYSTPWVAVGDVVAWPRMKSTGTRFPIMCGGNKAVVSIMADDVFVAKGMNPETVAL